MKSATTKILLLLSLPFLSWTAVVAQTLTATSGAPEVLDGVIGDGEWTSDPLVTNNGVTLYAMGDGEYLYLAAHWADATESVNKRRWQFDGATWERGPEDEDRIAFIWDMGLNGSDGAACLTMCHGDAMHTNTGFVDVWHWKAARGNAMGYVDDKYWDTDNRQSDPGKSAAIDNNTEAGGPAFMASGDPGANVDFLAADPEALEAFDPFGTLPSHTVAAAVPFDGSAAFEAGHTIPWYLMRPGEGDRGSVQAAGKWEDGWWTVEFRKPYAGGATGKVQSEFDFDVVPGESIEFTHEIFDNIGDEHAQDGFDFTVYTLDMTGLVSTSTELPAGDLPASYALRQNYPNPFNPATEIEFQVPRTTHATLAVYDLLGKRVATLTDEDVAPGVHRYTFHGAGLPSGVYFYRLETSFFVESRMMTFLK